MSQKDNDTFSGWNNFPEIKPTYDFEAIVLLKDGRRWIAQFKDGEWDFSAPRLFADSNDVVKWMAFPD